MFIESVSEKPVNEDLAGQYENLFYLLDGASPLQPHPQIPFSSAAWFVLQMEKALHKNASSSLTLEQIVHVCVDDILRSANLEFDSLNMPSATILLVRIKEGALEYFVLGDSVLLIQTKHALHKFSDESIAKLDNQVLAQMELLQKEQGGGFFEKRSQVSSLLEKNRKLKNTPEGYAILDCTHLWAGRALSGSFDLEDVKSFAMMSDGFEQLQSFTKTSDIQFYQMIEDYLDTLFEKLHILQDEDPDAQQVKRLKLRDDTTLLFVNKTDLLPFQNIDPDVTIDLQIYQ
jgi:hypothetical protein